MEPGSRISRVYRWDLDKTYLRTEFDTLRDLLRTAFEGAKDKRTIPGAATLLRELRGVRSPDGGVARVCFISGSPRQMRRVLTEKLHLDGVRFDEFILKPNLRNMLTGRFRAMREQVGYKLPALLSGRAGLPVETREVCFGDDAESDAFIYSLYADVLAGIVGRDLLGQILDGAGVYPEDAARTIELAAALPRADAVERIFILLDRRSAPRRFDRYGARLVPIYNYFQAALVLFQDQLLDAPAVMRVALEMADKHGYSLDMLRNSLQDVLRRGRVQPAAVQALGQAVLDSSQQLPALGELPAARDLVRAFAQRMRELGPLPSEVPPPAQGPIDYLKAMEEDLPRVRRR
ncbi:MAG: DUF2183 domain-containing protein [Myxococcales bacterium]|nr:hypothetical protein [Myxococcota bacterium]MDW8283516.1 DUF2183 domain-containing protein [Myxococcales bacterium]